jgi:hypothetical protein
MENKKKNKFKINAFDVFLILLVLCLIGTLVFRIYNGVAEDKNSYNNEYLLKFKCEGEYDSVIRYVRDGDAVYLASGELLGYITFAESNNTQYPLEIETSETSSGDPNNDVLEFVAFTGYMKLNGNAKKATNGNYYVVGDENIIEGSIITVHTRTAEFTVSLESIEAINNY